MEAQARAGQYDFLIIADQQGRIIASSTDASPGTKIPDTFITRQARTGVQNVAFERMSASAMESISPQLAKRAQVELAAKTETDRAN